MEGWERWGKRFGMQGLVRKLYQVKDHAGGFWNLGLIGSLCNP